MFLALFLATTLVTQTAQDFDAALAKKQAGLTQEARNDFKSLLVHAETKKNMTLQAQVLLELADIEFAARNSDVALLLVESLLKVSAAPQVSPEFFARALYLKASIHASTGELNRAHTALKALAKIRDPLTWTKNQQELLDLIETRLGINSELLDLSEKAPSSKGPAFLQELEKAHAFVEENDYVSAAAIFTRVLEKNASDLSFLDQFHAMYDLAVCLRELDDMTGASELADDLLESVQDKTLRTRASVLQATILSRQNAPEQAWAILRDLREENLNADEKSFIAALRESLDRSYEEKVAKAEHLIEALLYKEAIPQFLALIDSVKARLVPHIDKKREKDEIAQLLLATCDAMYRAKDFDALLSLSDLHPELDLGAPRYAKAQLFLGAGAYAKGRFELAADRFGRYLSLGEKNEKALRQEAALQQGRALFAQKTPQSLESALTVLATVPKTAKQYGLSQIIQAKISIEKNAIENALVFLHNAEQSVAFQDPLFYEMTYLRGVALSRQEHHEEAAVAFLQSIAFAQTTTTVSEAADWYKSALYELVRTERSLAHKALAKSKEQRAHFDSALGFAKQLAALPSTDQNALFFYADTLIDCGAFFPDMAPKERIDALFASNTAENTLEFSLRALITRAKAALAFEEKIALFEQSCDASFADAPSYPLAWIEAGRAQFQEGERLENTGLDELKIEAFRKSLAVFEKAAQVAKGKEEEADALMYQAQSLYKLGGRERIERGLVLMNSLSSPQFSADFLFTKAFLAQTLLENGKSSALILDAHKSFETLLTQYPSSPLAPRALDAIGSFAFTHQDFHKAANAYHRLATDYPQDSLAPSALYWAAEAFSQQNAPKEFIASLRRQLFEHYKEHPLAAQSYFFLYSFSDYLGPDERAKQHLESMEERFASSPYLVTASHLLGLRHAQDALEKGEDNESFTLAIDSYKKAVALYDVLNINITPDDAQYFAMIRFRSCQEEAKLWEKRSMLVSGTEQTLYLEQAEQMLQDILMAFISEENPAAVLLSRGVSRPPFVDESRLILARVFRSEGKLALAKEQYEALLKAGASYAFSGTAGLSKIALEEKDFERALKYSIQAEALAQPSTNTDDLASLWIDRSLCLLSLNKVDEAYDTIGRAVESRASPVIRTQAQYVRAELLERQGLHDMALKQLQSLAEESGQWGQAAQKKLRENYGFIR